MSEFHTHRVIKATRKLAFCEQCSKRIEVGSPAEYDAGKYDGYIYSNYTHPECAAAAREYSKLNDLSGEEWPWFLRMEDQEHDHSAWLLEHYPIVAERLGLKREVPA